MNKPLLGLVVGGVLGVFDGLSALLSAPEVAPQIMGIVVGSTVKGMLVGVIAGPCGPEGQPVPVGIAVGSRRVCSWPGSSPPCPDPASGKHYHSAVTPPGSFAGVLVGWATQKYGRRPGETRREVVG